MNNQQHYQQVAGSIADYLFQELGLHPQRGDYRVVSATSGPRVLTLATIINPRHTPKVRALAEQLSMATGLDRSSQIRVARGNRGTLVFEVPKPKALWYDVPIRALPRRRGLKSSVGIDGQHRPAQVNFADPLTPHCLIAGTTGSGKTNTERLFILNLAKQNTPDDVRLLLLDTCKRGMGWRPLAHLSHLAHPIVTDDAEALQTLSWVLAEMDRRAMEGRSHPHLFVGIDEAQALLDRDEFVRPISRLAAVGREFGIHLLLATQNPTADQLGDTGIKRNLTTRLVGKVDSAQAATVAAGIKESGAELLTGPGDQLLVQPTGVTRLTVALVTDQDTSTLPTAETVRHLDLGEFDDIDHVLNQTVDVDQTVDTSQAAPLEPAHVALALATGRGIGYLKTELKIGSARATRLKEFATAVLMSLTQDHQHTVVPLSHLDE